MPTPGQSFFPAPAAIIALVTGALLLWSEQAWAGKVMWKENPLERGCFALAFADSGQWFATTKGSAFKKGVCHGEAIQYEVDLAEGGESFTVSGASFCTYHVGDSHDISMGCRPTRSR